MSRFPKKEKIGVLIILIVLLVSVVLGTIYFFVQKGGRKSGERQGGLNLSGMMTEEMVAATGVTSVGVTEESFDVERLTTGIEIEEVYVSSGEEITAGTKILKLSEEDLTEARDELQKNLREAELAYRAGAIEYEQNKITAVYERDSAILAGKQAKETYDETVAGLDSDVEQAQEELTDAKEQIAEYQSYVTNGTYREYFKVDEYQTIYDENLKLLTERMEEYGIHWPEVTGSGSGSGAGAGSGSGEGGAADSNSSQGLKQEIQMLSSLYKILEQNLKDLEQAQEDYDDAVRSAALELQTLELSLPGLEQAVAEAKENYATRLLQAELTYETALTDAENADSNYETAIEKAESDYEALKDDYEDAEENLKLFEELVGDGYFYASGDGTILRMMLRSGQDLTSEGTVFVYGNQQEMTVTVSVDQADISKLALGDEAVVMMSEYGNFQASVSEINPVSSSTGRTSVAYNVTVVLSGDTADVPANTSVTVVFGMSMDQIPTNQTPGGDRKSKTGEKSEEGQMSGEAGKPEEGQVPGEAGKPEEGQMPGGTGKPEEGQVPGEAGKPEEGQMPEGTGKAERGQRQGEVKQND